MSDAPDCVCSLLRNEKEINALLIKVGLTLPSYLDLTGGAPVEPLAIPPKFMDRKIWIETTKKLCDEVDAAREWQDRDAINQALKNRWNHVFYTHPIDAEIFRSQLSALLEERYTFIYNTKCHADYPF